MNKERILKGVIELEKQEVKVECLFGKDDVKDIFVHSFRLFLMQNFSKELPNLYSLKDNRLEMLGDQKSCIFK
uniref:Uncharacterized protein n=1 Tax=uncultured prokaryote TaxID=198431 RepID=A0A0H5Q6T2_9ZZZZ|nr:hypothetical protein [uncultured prokaryote]